MSDPPDPDQQHCRQVTEELVSQCHSYFGLFFNVYDLYVYYRISISVVDPKLVRS
jgi:hypothetical protein